jgi:sugar/nucleoside kinase (ribokinase family)
VKLDVLCTGPVFLDLTFEGLKELPAPGRERFARELHASPGGAGITAVGLSRLGLRTAVVPGPGGDLAGRTLRSLLEADGVFCPEPTAKRTPVSAIVPLDGERSIISYEPAQVVETRAVGDLPARALVVGLDQLRLIGDGVRGYITLGDQLAERYAGALPDGLSGARALFVNAYEARLLTGEPEPEAAALALAEHVPTAIVTRGEDGAVAASGGALFQVQAPRVEARDTTGAGDLFVAAYVWGDLQELPLEERLRRAAVYATLSVQTATGAGGAATVDELEDAVTELGAEIVETASAQGAQFKTASSKERG